MNEPPAVAVLTGPTAVGKTEIAVEVALGLNAEILSLDSMAVYRRLEVGAAKPSAADRARVPHHLIDLVDVSEPFSVSEYLRAAMEQVHRLTAAGKTPLFVGGTLYYYRALTRPFTSACPANPALRARLAALPEEDLRRRLEAVDAELAARITPGDVKRLIRGLEVFEQTGKPLSVWQQESRARPPLVQARTVALIRDREAIYRRVEARCEAMLAAGLVEEVQGFLDEGIGLEATAMQGHGYKEIARALRGEYSLEEGIRLMKRNTRHYVKYHLNWLKRMPEVRLVNADAENVEARCRALLRVG